MRSVCVNLLHICIVVYIYVCVVFVTMLDFETVDLGYNNPLVDKCDYIDHTMLDPTEHKDHVDLAIMQLNSRGLLGKLDKLKSLIQDVRKTQRVHVIALAETWLKQNNVNRVKLPGF